MPWFINIIKIGIFTVKNILLLHYRRGMNKTRIFSFLVFFGFHIKCQESVFKYIPATQMLCCALQSKHVSESQAKGAMFRLLYKLLLR